VCNSDVEGRESDDSAAGLESKHFVLDSLLICGNVIDLGF